VAAAAAKPVSDPSPPPQTKLLPGAWAAPKTQKQKLAPKSETDFPALISKSQPSKQQQSTKAKQQQQQQQQQQQAAKAPQTKQASQLQPAKEQK
jgi:hypothetical protein